MSARPRPQRPGAARTSLVGERGLSVVALGGGHGLAANLRALRHLAEDLTAVVTVADNGGSSGRIREEMPVLPPGDLRMALAALCEDSDWGDVWRDVVQHRFRTEGELDGHSLGNLLIVTLWQILGDPIAGLDKVAELLGARGRVLPMALEPLDIEARIRGLDGVERTVRGQAEVAVTRGSVRDIRLLPEDPTVPPEVIEALMTADWIVIGPGSWYTSVLPHLMVPELAEAIRTSPARRCITMNLARGTTETEGMSSADLLDVVLETSSMGGELRLDAMIADPTHLDDAVELADRAETLGIRPLLRQVSVRSGRPEHDPVRLAAAYRDIFDGAYGDVADARADHHSQGGERVDGADR